MLRQLIACAAALNAAAAFAQSQPAAPQFRAGDTATYALVGAGGAASESSHMVYTVTAVADDGVWIGLGYSLAAGSQSLKMLIDPATKRIKRVIQYGTSQAFSDPNAAPAELGPEETIKVPAGEFRCVDRKVAGSSGAVDHYWIDSSGVVPIFGYIRIRYGLPGASGVQLDLVYYRRGP